MSTSPPPLPTCSACQTVLDPNGTCPRCRAPEDWTDQIEALDFVVRRFVDWHKSGQLTDRQLQMLSDQYAKDRDAMVQGRSSNEVLRRATGFPPRDECWSCGQYLYTSSSHCHECGAPITHAGVRSLRYWRFLYHELQKHEESGWLTLRQSHEFQADTQERIDALRRNLERDRAPMVLPVEEPAQPRPRRRRRREEEPIEEVAPSRTFLEILLDPQSIQWLLAAGGALIVLGLIIWLMSLGLFENPGFVAFLLGAGNAVLLGGGYALMLATRFQTAGRALTLLACLVMPLHLWFYHTHNLLTLENNLWAAALVCCIIYTASAFLLKDSLFVYVLVAGITLTGLLLLAQMHHFGEILAPVTFFIILGLICLHAERAFPPAFPTMLAGSAGAGAQDPSLASPANEGTVSPFSRERFGMAFYWCSQPLFAIGLLLLLGSQMVGWLHQQFFRDPPFDVVNRDYLPWTLALVLAGTYAYIYSDLVVRRIGIYLYLAAITILWAEIHVLVLTDLAKIEWVVIVTLTLTALAVNVFQVALREKRDFLRTLPALGFALTLLPLWYALLLQLRATNALFDRDHLAWSFEITWPYVAAMAILALSARAGAFLYRHALREISIAYFFVTAAATLLFAACLAWMIGVKAWETQAPLIMIVPILYLLAAFLYRGHSPERPLVWCGHAAVIIMILVSMWTALEITPQVVEARHGRDLNLMLAVFFLEVSVFYAIGAFVPRNHWSMYLAALMFCAAVWQVLLYFQTPAEFFVVSFAVGGFALLLLYRFGVFEHVQNAERAIFQSANALTTLGFTAGGLLSLSRLLMRHDAAGEWRHTIAINIGVLITLAIISVLSAWIVQHQIWRRVHIVFSIVNVLLLVVMIHQLTQLSPWQQLEIFSCILGVVLLGFAYAGWYRETEHASDVVSMAFLFGSMTLVGPTLLAIVVYRIQRNFQPGWDDLALVASCIALFGSGVMCRIRATTVVGAMGMGAYLLIILIGLHRHLQEQWIVGIYLTLGGAVLFGTGLFLSLYRDRLLALPEKIRRREGLFRIFDWR